MPGIPIPRIRPPFRTRGILQALTHGRSGALPTQPPVSDVGSSQTAPGTQEEGDAVAAATANEEPTNAERVNVEQLRSALCAFLEIEVGRENTELLNRYIQTFLAFSTIMGDATTLGRILGQQEDEFLNTLEICRFISQQFEIELNSQLQLRRASPVDSDASFNCAVVPPAREAFIANLPFERVLPSDRLNFQHDMACCPVCVEPLIEGLVLTRLPCGHLYHHQCATTWLANTGSCPECRYEVPTAQGALYERERCHRMRTLNYKIVQCSCEHQSLGVHTCFFRDKTKLLCEQVTTNERKAMPKRKVKSSPNLAAPMIHDRYLIESDEFKSEAFI